MLQIKLLGECSLVYDGCPITGISSDRAQALLTHLVLRYHTPQSRQQLAAHLWIDSSDSQARTNLRKELSYLRKALPHADDLLIVEAKSLQWRLQPYCWVDVVSFEGLLKAADQAADLGSGRSHLEQALELYRGDLLPRCDDPWIEAERERLQQLRLRALRELIDRLEQCRDYRAAIAHGQQWLRLEPFSESVYCVLMRLYGLSGDRATALQLYHRCMTVLREELGVDPSTATRTLYEQLLHEQDLPSSSHDYSAHDAAPVGVVTSPLAGPLENSPASSTPCAPNHELLHPDSTLPLVGRSLQWAAMQQWMATPPPQRELLLLTGEPGIGKTRLLQELRRTLAGDLAGDLAGNPDSDLAGDRTYVLWGRGFEAEIVRPYGIWIDALRSLRTQYNLTIPAELGYLLPELGLESSPPSDRSRLFDAVVQWLSQLCQSQHSILIMLDDIQWIDEASSSLLHYASRLLQALPVWFACTARTKELEDNAPVTRVMQSLRRDRRLRCMALTPLTLEQTAELVAHARQGKAKSFAVEPVSVEPVSVEPVSVKSRTTESRTVEPLATALLTDGDQRQAGADRIFIDSGGNPLFVLEIARALYETNAESTSPSVYADSLEQLIGDRLCRLQDSARDLIPWAAALGQRFQPSRIAQVADYPLAKLLEAIEHLEREAIIRTSAAVSHERHSHEKHTHERHGHERHSNPACSNEIYYDFAHDIVRQVAYRQLSEPRRQLIHRQIAQRLYALASHDPSLMTEIAHHAALGSDRALAAAAALAAAEHSLKLFAYAEAAELAQRGIQHCQLLNTPTGIQLHLGLLRAVVMAGVAAEDVAALENQIHPLIQQARSLGQPEAESIGLEALMILNFERSNFTRLHQHSMRAIEASRRANPMTAVRMLGYGGSCLAEIGRDMARAEALLLEAQSLGARIGFETTDLLIGLGCVRRHHGDYAEARRLLEQASQIARVEQDHWRECSILGYLAMTELEAGNAAAAIPHAQAMAALATQMHGQGSEGPIAAALLALARITLQPLQEPLQEPSPEQAELERAIAQLRQIDAKQMLAYVLTSAAELDLQSDRPQQAAERAAEALQAAWAVHHPSGIALAWAVFKQSSQRLARQPKSIALAQPQEGDVTQLIQNQMDDLSMSTRACVAVARIADIAPKEMISYGSDRG